MVLYSLNVFGCVNGLVRSFLFFCICLIVIVWVVVKGCGEGEIGAVGQ